MQPDPVKARQSLDRSGFYHFTRNTPREAAMAFAAQMGAALEEDTACYTWTIRTRKDRPQWKDLFNLKKK